MNNSFSSSKQTLSGKEYQTMSQAEDNYYLDKESLNGIGVILRGKNIVLTGVSVHQESVRYRENDALTPFLKEDFYFFFDDEKPHLNFYAVPAILVLGYDSAGGYFAATDDDFSFEENFPLFYISAQKQAYFITEESSRFLSGEYRWQKDLRPADRIKIYESRQMAEKDFEIHDRLKHPVYCRSSR